MSQPLTTQVREHRGVLARAVHQHRRPRAAGADHLARARRRRAGSPAASAGRPRRARPTARIRRTPSTWKGSPECDAQARASRSGGRSSPSAHHAQRLERLVARARQHGRVDVADRPVDGAVGVERDHGAVVVPLHEPGADDLGDDGRLAGIGPGLATAGRMTPCRPVPTPPVPQHCPTPPGAGRPRAAHRRARSRR